MRLNSFTIQVNGIQATELRKQPDKPRMYLIVENRGGFPIRMKPDGPPNVDGTDGIDIAVGAKLEFWYPYAPDNLSIFFLSFGAAAVNQLLNISEGY